MTRYHRTRFAPAPTGYLHLGHIVNALAVWGVARASGTAVLLRIEDHDRQRCRPEFEAALLEDLDWLGLVPDQGPTAEFRRGASSLRQSDNSAIYQAAVEQLRAAGHHVYVCDCSRNTQTRAGAVSETAGEVPYDGRCRDRGLTPGPDRGWRVVLPEGEARFTDLRLGPQWQTPASQCGDLLLRDRRGNWTYQFAVAVDDQRQEVGLVVRGEDLLQSTGRQLHLAAMLGRPALPAFLHHTLILKPNGDKLSKGSSDTSVRALRSAGLSREALIGKALVAAGWSHEAGPVRLDDALGIAGPAALSRRS